MARINNREEFKNYCLRSLGAPVLRINVDDQQVEDRVDDAMDLFWEYHSDGSELVFLNIQVTAKHISDQFFPLPPETQSVLRVLKSTGTNGIANTNLQYQAYITDLMNPRNIMGTGLSGYFISQSFLSLLNDTFSPEARINFNKHYDKLELVGGWDGITVGNWISVEAYMRVTPEKSGDVWNNRWLKKYATALIKAQWGTNLMKFTGAQLPGGIAMNGETILNQATTEITALQEELHSLYETPPTFFMG